MRIAIHQPQYLPWLGYFDKMDRADVFVLLDDVQYKKNEWQNRNKIRNAESWQWLTVPVVYDFGRLLSEVKIDNKTGWRTKHLKSIEMNYSRAPYFKGYSGFFEELYGKEWSLLADLNSEMILYLKERLGIKTRLIKSSELGIKSSATNRLVDICGKLNADVYLSGAGGAEYLDEALFAAAGIKLEYQSYEHPVYKQAFDGFEPNMAVIDLMFMEGDKSLKIIRGGREK